MAQCAVLFDPLPCDQIKQRQPNDLMDNFRTEVLSRLKPRRPQLGLALRMTLGALLALGFAQALHLHLPLWAVLTAIIVTQLSVGRSLKTALDYFVGTIGGVIYGGVIAIFVPHSTEVELIAVLALVVAPLALLAALKPQFNVAIVTGIIVLLVPTMTQVAPLASAIDRVLEVGVGALTGLAVSFLVLPSRALGMATTSAALTLELMAASLRELLAGLTRGLDNEALHRLQDGIGHSLVKLGEIAGEAESERAAGLRAGPDTAPLLRTHAAAAARSGDDRPRRGHAVARRPCSNGSATRSSRSARRRPAICRPRPRRCAIASRRRRCIRCRRRSPPMRWKSLRCVATASPRN